MGVFRGLELGKRALLAQQYRLTTIGHNIANANTPGYTRQRVDLEAASPFDSPVGQLGSGVRVADVRQIRDLFLTTQYRQGNEQLGRWSQLDRAMQEVENIFREPSENGFSQVLSDFFDAWQTLSQNPESSAGRAAVREQATLVANAFRQISGRLDDLQRWLDKEVSGRVENINRIAADIASLNKEIGREELGGSTANDLRDQRDQLIDELSQYVDVNVVRESNGVARVFIGSMELVESGSYSPLTTETVGSGSHATTNLVWRGTSMQLQFSGGELAGLIEARDQLVPQYTDSLNKLASAFVSQINTLHRSGSGLDGISGRDFFNPAPESAADITLSSDVQNDLNKIAASDSGGPGDNATAVAIANLQNSLTMNNGTSTFNEFYAEIVGTVGVRASEAKSATSNAQLVRQQIEFSRQSVQGVSLDEEMANLIEAQHAYDAAARVISTMDRALNTLINDMGVGR